MAGDVTLTFNHFPRIAAAFPEIVGQVVRKVALDVEANAKANIQQNGQIDTGFMLNSVYTVTDQRNGHDSAEGSAKAANPTAEMLPNEETASRPTQAAVCVGASYGVYQEFGTSHQPARPYLVPAVERERPAWEQALRTLETRLTGLGGGGGE